MSIQKVFISFIIFGSTVFVHEFDAAVWIDTAVDKKLEQSNGTAVTSPIALELNFSGPMQAVSSMQNISFDLDLLPPASEIQAEESPAMDFLLMLNDPNQLNSFILQHPDLLHNGTLEEVPTNLTMDSNQTSSSSLSINNTKLRSLIEQQPNVSNILIAALNKANEKQSNRVEEHQRVRRDVNASQFNQLSPKQYQPELNQQNLTEEQEQFSDCQGRERESQRESTSGFEQVVKPETLTDDTSPIQMETILDQLDGIRDMCIEILVSSTSSPDVILIDELDQVRVICMTILVQTDNMILIEMEDDNDKEQRLQTQPASRGKRSVDITTVTPHRI